MNDRRDELLQRIDALCEHLAEVSKQLELATFRLEHRVRTLTEAMERKRLRAERLHWQHLEAEPLRAAARAVCRFDWSDNDDDAVAAIDNLRRALR